MDEQQLQQKEAQLRVKENDLSIRESDLNNRESRMNVNLDLTINRQEFLRRAVEVGANALNKLQSLERLNKPECKIMDNLVSLVDTSVLKLKEELSK